MHVGLLKIKLRRQGMEVKTNKHQSLQRILVALFLLLKQDFTRLELPCLGETVYRGCFGEVS